MVFRIQLKYLNVYWIQDANKSLPYCPPELYTKFRGIFFDGKSMEYSNSVSAKTSRPDHI